MFRIRACFRRIITRLYLYSLFRLMLDCPSPLELQSVA
uniref:Uncharacterized protein n=1 Tax=Arundo donax TaxID=35708 RepID=A0A0A8XU65_ARUDO